MIDERLPTVKKAIDILFRDWGGVTPMDIVLPAQYDWERIERFLTTLPEEELEAVATGNLEVANKIISRQPEEGDYAMAAIGTVFEQHIGSRIIH